MKGRWGTTAKEGKVVVGHPWLTDSGVLLPHFPT